MQRTSLRHRNSESRQISPFECRSVPHCHMRVPVALHGLAQRAMKDEERVFRLRECNTQGMKPDSFILKVPKHLCTESTGELLTIPTPDKHPQILGMSRSGAQNAHL